MTDINKLITDNLTLWSGAIKKRSATGKGSSRKIDLIGVNKLRDLILQLAMKGKLVEQNSDDEPASKLLERITKHREQLVSDKVIKKGKKLPELTMQEKQGSLPKGWVYERFGNIYELAYGDNLPKPKRTETGEFEVYGSNGVVGTHNRASVSSPCIVIGRKGSAGALNKSSANGCWVTDVAYSLTPFSNLNLDFVYYQLQTIGLDNLGKGIKPGLNRNEAYLICVALPPVDEQKRIVTKVEELMALCDQLEQQTEASIDAHQLLVEELLSTLTNSENAQAFEQNWARIAEHFDLLFTTEHSIEQLKQTILQLAVMGKLVPQDPTDEPASKLLERIAQEKAQLIKDKVIKKEKALPALTDEEKPFDLPTGWALARVGNLVSKLGSGSTPRGGKAAYVESGVPFLRSQNVWNDGIKTDDIAYIPEDTHNSMSNTKVYPNDVLLNITGASLGRATIFPQVLQEANVSQHVTIIRLIEKEMSEFVLLGIHSPMIQRLVWDRQVGVAIEGLSKKVLELFEFPIPPLPEQKRIISKVQSLMALCEQLKANIIAANTTQVHLAATIVDKALGRTQVIKLEEKEEKKTMKISTELSLGSVTYDKTAILAPLIGESGAEAKSVWSKSGLKLPEFYRQLKSEITAGFVAKPAKAEFEG